MTAQNATAATQAFSRLRETLKGTHWRIRMVLIELYLVDAYDGTWSEGVKRDVERARALLRDLQADMDAGKDMHDVVTKMREGNR